MHDPKLVIFLKEHPMSRILAMVLFVSIPAVAFAQSQPGGSCTDYPLRMGKDVETTETGLKITATGDAPVSFDDVSAVRDARDEAEIEAKNLIVKFLTEEISSDNSITRTVNESSSMQGEQKTAQRQEAISRVKTLRQSANALLRGVVVLGSCYTPGKEYRVTVGIKPELIKQAEELAGNIQQSIQRQPTPTSQNTGRSSSRDTSSGSGTPSPSTSINRQEGFSDTDRLKKF